MPPKAAGVLMNRLRLFLLVLLAAGLARASEDVTAPSSDTCSSGGGSTVEIVRCSGSAWTVISTTSNPTTICTEQYLPRWGQGYARGRHVGLRSHGQLQRCGQRRRGDEHAMRGATAAVFISGDSHAASRSGGDRHGHAREEE